ncbi:MAG: hypothetical protein PHE83_18300 [Opitutaceae bacterium]|nr:hypothetical protein [Opitutaceae bacterium]
MFKEMRDDAVEADCRDQKIKVKTARTDPRLDAVAGNLGGVPAKPGFSGP